MLPLSLTRPDFDRACEAFMLADDKQPWKKGWTWNDHPTYPLGYMSRQISLPDTRAQSTEDILEDNAVDDFDDDTATTTQPLLSCMQYICYSATFHVPVFYFTIANAAGTPLPLEEILSTPLFKRYNFPLVEATSFGITSGSSTFPLLSQGDHPTLGTPSWYLHPCETSAAVAEIFDANPTHAGEGEVAELVSWLNAWFMVLSTAVSIT